MKTTHLTILIFFVLTLVSTSKAYSQSLIYYQTFDQDSSNNWDYTVSSGTATFIDSATTGSAPFYDGDTCLFLLSASYDTITFDTAFVDGYTDHVLTFTGVYIGGLKSCYLKYRLSINGVWSSFDTIASGLLTKLFSIEDSLPSGADTVILQFEAHIPSESALFFDNFRVTGIASLPVDWLEQVISTNERGETVLHWSTAQEVNNEYFSILRSLDGEYYKEIAQVPGKGNCTQVSEYSYTDQQPLSQEVVYYKICQKDYDGTSDCNDVLVISKTELNVLVTPNPFHTLLYLSAIEVKPSTIVSVEVLSSFGEQLIQRNYLPGELKQQQQINVEGLTSGLYYLRIIAEDRIQIIKLIKE